MRRGGAGPLSRDMTAQGDASAEEVPVDPLMDMMTAPLVEPAPRQRTLRSLHLPPNLVQYFHYRAVASLAQARVRVHGCRRGLAP